MFGSGPFTVIGLLAGVSWGGVIALMIMHVVVAACGVAAYLTFLPLDRPSGPA
ncbi:hypothetical protein [uncultured Jatrophihabitans sp.]|uniref:hypothetical protein n=1 Tax=uncultured Jatrophihabitans sp. TaxID=1610747 RepID=UPI0035CAAC71